jgi:GMP synthase-like glutamine amidotransferase
MTRDGEYAAQAANGQRRLVVIEHDPDAPAGLLGDWAASSGLAVRTVRLHAGEPLPGTGSCDAAAVLGSEKTAYDDKIPWLADELSFVDRCLGESVPVLGICFGGQVLARVLGARLYRLGEPEIGWVQVASQSPGLAEGPWPSWHRDAFDLPPGATALAVNDVSLQGFSAGPHVGVQFHPEATEPIVASWQASVPPADQPATAPRFADGDHAWQRAAVNAEALFSAWLGGDLASGG